MTREETVKIIRIMVDSYPNYKPSNLSETVDVWCDMLSEYSYQQVAVALKSYILSDTSGFAPSIGQLVSNIKTISQPRQLSENEAWALVSKALRNGYYGAEEEFSKLPKLVQDAVGHPSNLRDWSRQDESALSVIQSNFQRVYRTVAQRETEISKMSTEVRALIDKINSNIGLEIKEVAAIEQKLIEYTDESAETEDVPKEFEEYLSKLRG